MSEAIPEQLPPSETDAWLRRSTLDYHEKEAAIARCDALLAEIKRLAASEESARLEIGGA